MITRGLIEKFFEAAMIQRWNDHVKPVEFNELDKQSHKAIIAYLLAKCEQLGNINKINWTRLIEGLIFEFLPRVIMTDIKPPVYHKMMEEKEEEINTFVLKNIEKDIKDIKGNLLERFKKYLFDPNFSKQEKRILKAAHYIATNWEFKIIYHSCPFIYGIEETKLEIEKQIEDHADLLGVQKIVFNKDTYGFIDLCGQLRFQQRWGQTFRIPKTSVLGHMLVVAMIVYIITLENKGCEKIRYNNFFASLFHDLPEVLTRDIISPIKKSVRGLKRIINKYENIQLEKKLYPLLSDIMKNEIEYFLRQQFKSRIKLKERIQLVNSDKLYKDYNYNKYNCVDGELIDVIDQFVAFVEASITLQHGIVSDKLEEGKRNIYEKYNDIIIAGTNMHTYFDWFNGH